ncbi:hypothetical protein [Nevskia ramosa]|uniref:hypothetical protein n=1 Tax=Nevskia ramosa TaxID=64002 RepID=UPI003D11016B
MKTTTRISFAALLLSGLVLMLLGARIWSAPDVFALEIGQSRLPAEAVSTLALKHGAVLLGLGAFALVSAFLSPVIRWLALGLLIASGLAAWFGLWQFAGASSNAYAAALKTLLVADGLSLMAITAWLDADRPGPQPTDAAFHFHWG